MREAEKLHEGYLELVLDGSDSKDGEGDEE